MRGWLAGLALAALAAGAEAAPVGYTSFWALGDSLSDPGNLSRATGGAVPGEPYFEGRFSDGPVWAERVAGDFERAGLATGNFAYGSAAVSPPPLRPIGAPPVVDLPGQIEAFGRESAGRLGRRPVASLWFGANDLLFGGVPQGRARTVGRAAADGVADGALRLREFGVRDVVLFNLPALEDTPNYQIFQPEAAGRARRGTRAFNATLDRRAEGLRRAGMNVVEVDAFGLFEELLDEPERFGVVDATTPCLVPGVAYCGDEAAPSLAFFDPVHPTSTIHEAIADAARAEVAPVPLPAPAALLLAGIAGLGAARLRARGWRRAS
jgi:outer membrane lipase/esterase